MTLLLPEACMRVTAVIAASICIQGHVMPGLAMLTCLQVATPSVLHHHQKSQGLCTLVVALLNFSVLCSNFGMSSSSTCACRAWQRAHCQQLRSTSVSGKPAGILCEISANFTLTDTSERGSIF